MKNQFNEPTSDQPTDKLDKQIAFAQWKHAIDAIFIKHTHTLIHVFGHWNWTSLEEIHECIALFTFCLYLTITSWNFNLYCFSIISEGRHARLKKNLFEFELIYLTFHIESIMVLSVVMFGEVCVFACYITKYWMNRSTAFPSIEIHSRLTLLLATSDLKCPKASVIMNANRRCLTHYTFVQ